MITISRSVLLSMKNVSDESLGTIETRMLCSVICFEIRTIYEIMWKYCRAGQAEEENVAHAYCMLVT